MRLSGLRAMAGKALGVMALAAPATVLASETAGPVGGQAIPMSWWIAPIGAVAALLMAWVIYRLMVSAPAGNDRMQEIAGAVREGAFAYLRRQYKVVSIVFLVLLLIFTALAFMGVQNPFVPVAFLTGGFFSGLCGFIGMNTATKASNRTAEGARNTLNRGLQVAFRSGAVMGLVVVGFGLLDIAAWYLVLNWIYDNNVWGLTEHLITNKYGATQWTAWAQNITSQPEFTRAKLIEITTTMITFGMGASTQALFARVGGGIFTKAADVGADLVGKVEAGIPEDDPRNPATIADNVGDNVGDVAGMGADLYESYCGSILAAAALGAALLVSPDTFSGAKAVIAPMVVAGIGNILSIIGIFMVRTREDATQKTLLRALLLGTLGSSVLILLVLAGLAHIGFITWPIFGAVTAGLLAGVIIGQSTEYYTSDEYKPTRGIADQTVTGPATTIIAGIAVGMLSSAIPVITVVAAILVAFGVTGGFSDTAAGLYGVAFAAVGMLSTLGVTLATDAYGPIADNAGGNAEMSHLDPEVRKRTDALDALGNTTAATGKGFAIGSAALTALALIAAYVEEVRLWLGKLANQETDRIYEIAKTKVAFVNGLTVRGTPEAALQRISELTGQSIEAIRALPEHTPVVGNDWLVVGTSDASMMHFMRAYDVTLMNPLVIGGLMLGSMMVFVFCALTMRAVGRAAGSMVEEVRRQFKEKPGIMQGTDKPDYARCVAISTAGAQREMIVPAFLAILVPLAVGLVLGVAGIIGLLAGGLATGFVAASMLNNAGGAWDNAKKYIEKGNMGGKRSDPHKAAVVGDTVGDPFKDTSGPSLNILIKLMSMVAVVFAGVIVRYAPQIGEFLGFGLR